MDATKSCPDCGGEVQSITDLYRGSPDGLDNFDAARDRLVVETVPEAEAVDEDDGAFALLGESEVEMVESSAEFEIIGERQMVVGHDDEYGSDGDGVVTTERSCVDCSWSERVV